LTCIIRVYRQQPSSVDGGAPNGNHQNIPVRCFDFDVPPDVVAEYFYVEPPPEEVAPPPIDRNKISALMASLQTQPVAPVTQPTVVRRDAKEIAETFNRLTKPTRTPNVGKQNKNNKTRDCFFVMRCPRRSVCARAYSSKQYDLYCFRSLET
jgi:hypothetical protein